MLPAADSHASPVGLPDQSSFDLRDYHVDAAGYTIAASIS